MTDREKNNTKVFTIDISTIEKVKDFSVIASKYNFDMTVRSGRYAIDAKSIMGLFSLDVSKKLTLELEFGADQEEDVDNLIEDIREYIIW